MDYNPELQGRDPLTGRIIGAAVEVHRYLGPGLLESTYEECLCLEMEARGLGFVRQTLIPIVYKGKTIAATYRLDLIIEQKSYRRDKGP